MLTATQLNILSTANLSTDAWPVWLCHQDAVAHPRRSQNWYRRRWNRGASFVKGVLDSLQTTSTEEEAEQSEKPDNLQTGAPKTPDNLQTTPTEEQAGQSSESDKRQTGGSEAGDCAPYICNLTPLKGGIDNTSLSSDGLLDFDAKVKTTARLLWDECRPLLLLNGVDMRWSDTKESAIAKMLKLYGEDDTRTVLHWWGESQSYAARWLRQQGHDGDPFDADTVLKGFQSRPPSSPGGSLRPGYIDLATTQKVEVETTEQPQQYTNPFLRIVGEERDA